MITRIYELTDIDLPEELTVLKQIFLPSLHDVCIAKNLKCFCKLCAAIRKAERSIVI